MYGISMELWNIYEKDHQSASNFGYLGYPPIKSQQKTEKLAHINNKNDTKTINMDNTG